MQPYSRERASIPVDINIEFCKKIPKKLHRRRYIITLERKVHNNS
jgi:hypothetical protein